MLNPTVSIVITNYNYGKFLPRCLRSCLSQKFSNYEVILVDDSSTDNSTDVAQPFLESNENLKLICNSQNLGVAESANIAVNASRGQFFIRVDSDDFVTSAMSYIMYKFLEANHYSFGVACDYYLVDNYEDKIQRQSAKESPISCGIMYRRDLFLELGGYNPKMRHREEEELRKRLGEKYRIDYLKMPFYRYRMHDSNKTKTKEYQETKI
jgi:glycosyltransferase involved in cell wall biosynthesis